MGGVIADIGNVFGFNSATRQQQNAQNNAMYYNMQQGQQAQANQRPWMQEGQASLEKLGNLLGTYDPKAPTALGAAPVRQTQEDYDAAMKKYKSDLWNWQVAQNMGGGGSWRNKFGGQVKGSLMGSLGAGSVTGGPLTSVAAGAYGGYLGGLRPAAGGMPTAPHRQTDAEYQQLMDQYGIQQGKYEQDLAAYNAKMKKHGSLLKPFEYDPNQDPSTQFRFNKGQEAVEASALGKGGYFSGATGQALTDYGQNFASQEYQNAFNRDLVSKNNVYNMLSQQAGQGQIGTTQAGMFGTNTAQNVGNLQMQGAQAGAMGAQGMYGSAGRAIGGIADAYNYYNYLNAGNNPYPNASYGGPTYLGSGFGGGGGAQTYDTSMFSGLGDGVAGSQNYGDMSWLQYLGGE